MNHSASPVAPEQIQAAHDLYCSLTGQKLTVGFDRQRLWFELLRLGYTLEDLKHVILYLQKEIRHQRRNVGALKLSNLLQPDRFEEDLNISRLRLHPSQPPATVHAAEPIDPVKLRQGRARAIRHLQQLKAHLAQNSFLEPTEQLGKNSTD